MLPWFFYHDGIPQGMAWHGAGYGVTGRMSFSNREYFRMRLRSQASGIYESKTGTRAYTHIAPDCN
jgi:hypothetical protein